MRLGSLVLITFLLTSGCGFHLRSFELTSTVSSAYVASDKRNFLTEPLRTSLRQVETTSARKQESDENKAALGEPEPLVRASWPALDESALVQERLQLVVQVNGKVRGHVDVPADVAEDAAREAALSVANVARHVDGKSIRKFILIPGKLINIVAN